MCIFFFFFYQLSLPILKAETEGRGRLRGVGELGVEIFSASYIDCEKLTDNNVAGYSGEAGRYSMYSKTRRTGQ